MSSRSVCGHCWCPWDDEGNCACPLPEINKRSSESYNCSSSPPVSDRTNELVEDILNDLSIVKAFSSAYTDMTEQVDKAWRTAINNLIEIRRINDV